MDQYLKIMPIKYTGALKKESFLGFLTIFKNKRFTKIYFSHVQIYFFSKLIINNI